jgi:hypothetical protein
MSAVGYDLMRQATLRGISIRVNAIDASRAYQVDVVSNPDGVPAIIGSLTLPVSTQSARTTALAPAATAAGTSIGVRIVRTAGSGQSTFNKITVLVEWEF